MTKKELEARMGTVMEETKQALETLYGALNQGQQKKLLKEPEVKILFDRYGVVYEP
ncbi:MAG: hypothetical protein IKT58_04800 [Oscillospiraceae bacterium]|nr:hypothetical protein [Oscillospiraceae bacterium]